MPDRLISPLTRLQISAVSLKPLDLSLSPLEKKVLQEFKDHVPIHIISENFQLDITHIYKMISKKKVIKIKINRRYSSDIKFRIQEASLLRFSTKEIAEIFHLKKSEAFYLSNLDKKKLKEELSPFIKFASSKSLKNLVFYKVTTYTTGMNNNLRKV
jgi:hypothetical protein